MTRRTRLLGWLLVGVLLVPCQLLWSPPQHDPLLPTPISSSPDAGEFMGTVMLGGFRAILINLMWIRAMDAYDEGRYHEIPALMDTIGYLQPRLESVWLFNASVMIQNIASKLSRHERYLWMQRGLRYLASGLVKNPTSWRLPNELLWQHLFGFRYDEANPASGDWHLRQEWAADADNPMRSSNPTRVALAWGDRAAASPEHPYLVDVHRLNALRILIEESFTEPLAAPLPEGLELERTPAGWRALLSPTAPIPAVLLPLRDLPDGSVALSGGILLAGEELRIETGRPNLDAVDDVFSGIGLLLGDAAGLHPYPLDYLEQLQRSDPSRRRSRLIWAAIARYQRILEHIELAHPAALATDSFERHRTECRNLERTFGWRP